jgi:hypothetical protein
MLPQECKQLTVQVLAITSTITAVFVNLECGACKLLDACAHHVIGAKELGS